MKFASKLDPSFIESYKDKTPPWGPIGYIVYKRTYARMTNEGTTEEWYQTVGRCCQGLLDIGGVFTGAEIKQIYDYIFNLKCSLSGRALWQLGTETVLRIGSDSLQNCWHVAINEPYAFCFTFNQLMLGGGVGFNITPEQVYELPTVKYGVSIKRIDSPDVDFIVPDNREGWVELLKKILDCFFYTGKNLNYSTMCIRQKGKPIKTFGGTASGSEILVEGLNRIVSIISSRVNSKLRPIDCLDILNIEGEIVVAGNVRRSAELAAGASNDLLFLTAKTWDDKSIPNWRTQSNNSVITDSVGSLPSEFWHNYYGHGEPYGIINLDLCRSHGRLSDGLDYRPDRNVTGTNPCGEITLESYEPCNLGELFLPNLGSMEEFLTASCLIYKACKTISKHPFSDDRVNEVVNRNQRLGLGVTGVLQGNHIQEPNRFDTVYNMLEELDIDYSRMLGVNRSIKLTCVKPSGTLSLLPGVTPGIHPDYAPYYIRRMRLASNDPLVKACRDNGYSIEPVLNIDGSRNLGTMVVSFPIKSNGAILAKDISVTDQLDFQALLQSSWSDNSVSMTCYYHKNEIETIKEYLHENFDGIKTISFLLHSEHGFAQAPYEEINKEQYNKLTENTKQISSIKDDTEREFDENLECVSGACPIR